MLGLLATDGEAVGIATPVVWLGSAGDGAMVGTGVGGCVDGDVDAGEPQATTNATVHHTTRRARMKRHSPTATFRNVSAHTVSEITSGR